MVLSLFGEIFRFFECVLVVVFYSFFLYRFFLAS